MQDRAEDEMSEKQSSERWIVGTLLIVALLTFFFPLVSLQVPILGSQEVSGYDLINKAKEFDQALDAFKSKGLGESTSTPSQLEPNDSESSESRSTMPLSAQTLSLIPIEIVLGFACALIALLFCLGSFSSTPTKAFSTLGSIAAVAAILHLTVANSDLHSWFREQMKLDSSALSNNPLAGLAQQIASLAANSIQLKPGAGLYVLAVSLSLTTIILFSRLLSASSSGETAIEPYFDQSNGKARTPIFVILLIVAFVAVVVVLNHKAPSAPTKGAFDGEFSVNKALISLFGNYDPSHKSSSVVVTNEKADNSTGNVTLLLDSPFFQGSEQKHLLVTSTAVTGEECHACDAEIGAYVYARREGGWTPEIADREIGRFGAWGVAGKARVIKVAPEVYGFSLTIDDMHQGEADSSELFVAPVSGHFHPVLSIGTESDNKGNCGSTDPEMTLGHAPCVESESTIHFLNSIHNGYFDIEVDESGTANPDQGVIPTNSRKIYLFSGEKYVE
jgi:uncharacterized membrane protein